VTSCLYGYPVDLYAVSVDRTRPES
jgi:hypothetical protein